MKPVGKVILLLFIFSICLPIPSASADLVDIFRDIQNKISGVDSILENEIIEGLKQALEIGTSNSVEMVSALNGYYQNPEIRIPLPDSVQKVKKLLIVAGYEQKVDAFELSMNRAAEHAASGAKDLFLETIRHMTFSDARKILNGRDNEATLYFEDKTRGQLFEKFEPIVHSTMSEVGVTRSYQDLNSIIRSIPFADPVSFDLDKYVTDKAMNGLFLMLEEEERKIRQDPAARVTELLRKVFKGK